MGPLRSVLRYPYRADRLAWRHHVYSPGPRFCPPIMAVEPRLSRGLRYGRPLRACRAFRIIVVQGGYSRLSLAGTLNVRKTCRAGSRLNLAFPATTLFGFQGSCGLDGRLSRFQRRLSLAFARSRFAPFGGLTDRRTENRHCALLSGVAAPVAAFPAGNAGGSAPQRMLIRPLRTVKPPKGPFPPWFPATSM